ncbi:unnamed protein product, partial [Hapterophycus canaliculatus]
ETLQWLLRETFEPKQTSESSFLSAEDSSKNLLLVEVGPRLSFESAVSSNAKSICRASGIESVTRLEISRRFLVSSARPLNEEEKASFVSLVHDRMTEMEYPE